MQRRSKLSRRRASIDTLESRLLFSASPVIIGYLPDYELGRLSLSSIDIAALTQVNYFSITPTSTGSLPSASTDGYSFASQLVSLVAKAHSEPQRVSVFITLDPATPFQTIAASSTATTNLVNNLLTFCSTYDLDGIDLDYEPGNGSLSQAQMNQWGSFLETLHNATSSHGLLVSEAVQVSPPYIIPTAYLSYVDRYLVMDYALDYNSSAPYAASLTYLQGWANYGVPKADLYMGIPFYGSSGTSWSNSTAESYFEILNSYAQANGAYPSPSTDTVTIGGVTWGFNGVTTVQEKMQYVINNGYGGVMIWELGQDNFSGNGYGSQALLPAIVSTLGAATETWTGAVSTAWNTPGNWNYGEVPAAGTNIVISGTPTITSPLDGGSITLNGGTLTFAAGTGVSIVSSLLIGSNATVNLINNTLLIDYATGSDPISTIAGYLKTGFDSGAWIGAGIDSSAAASNPAYALGYADGKDGIVSNLSSGEIEVAYTLYGDANLDGTVNGSDFSILAANFGQGFTNWDQGNFNYDGSVNGSDFSLLASNFGQGANDAALVLPAPSQVFTAAALASTNSDSSSSQTPAITASILTSDSHQILSKKKHH